MKALNRSQVAALATWLVALRVQFAHAQEPLPPVPAPEIISETEKPPPVEAQEPTERRAQDQLEKLQDQYGAAAALFGEDHVLIMPVLYWGMRCDEGALWKPGRQGADCTALESKQPNSAHARGGIAGALFLPLYGWRFRWGKHNNEHEWWPVVQTREQGDAFARFVERASGLAEIVGGGKQATELEMQDRYATLKRAFEQMLGGQLGSGGVLTEYEVETLRSSLQQLDAQGGTHADKVRDMLALIREFRLLTQSDPGGRSRHNVLVGPLYALPLNDSIVDDYFVGVAAEIGTRKFGITLTVGVRESYKEAPWQPVGLFFGIGLSGELTDDLINTVSGASSLAGKM